MLILDDISYVFRPALWFIGSAAALPRALRTPAERHLFDPGRRSRREWLRRGAPLDSARSLFEGTAISEGCETDCSVFVGQVTSCSDDKCACQLVPAAQVCAQCTGDGPAMEKYNGLLDMCAAVGYVTEGATTYVETASAASGSAASATSTTVVTVTITRSDVTSSATPSVSVTTLTVTSGIVQQETSTASEEIAESSEVHTVIQSVIGAPSATVVTVTASFPTQSQTANHGVTLTTTATPVPSSETLQVAAAANQSLTLTPSAHQGAHTNDTELTKGALISTRKFFTYDIELECEADCEHWSDLEETCNDEECVCTVKSMESAGKCSACISKGVKRDNYPAQMIAYGGFRKNCTAEFPEVAEQASSAAAASPTSTGLLASFDMKKTTQNPNATRAAQLHESDSGDANDTDETVPPPDTAFLRAMPWPVWAWHIGPAMGMLVQILIIGVVTGVHMLLMG